MHTKASPCWSDFTHFRQVHPICYMCIHDHQYVKPNEEVLTLCHRSETGGFARQVFLTILAYNKLMLCCNIRPLVELQLATVNRLVTYQLAMVRYCVKIAFIARGLRVINPGFKT